MACGSLEVQRWLVVHLRYRGGLWLAGSTTICPYERVVIDMFFCISPHL